MPTIYLLRHGETVWNTLGRFQGHQDSSLTLRGIEQADFVAEILHRELSADDALFEMRVSPLGRTRETADRVQLKLSLPSNEDARLMEVTVGCWDGMSKSEIHSEFAGYLEGTDAFDWYFKSPDGETFDDACIRAKAWLADIGRPTVAISHGLFGRIIRGVYAGLSRREMLELPVPQDGLYRLDGGQFSFVGGPLLPN
ncbi:histidine phosphatase family protein [Agrobacterium tumefaciens]|uniref:histidine phosphatase family protein n=1 Tax=Agrobacterium tumefaciens TaxID=358 RepID=UPI0021CECF3D|nr:histidine phosphatase family protein [Agrobacterium tumefaciens]UXS45931.1 histidine phosphatase family protein [Agrobacterium tumefaciens]